MAIRKKVEKVTPLAEPARAQRGFGGWDAPTQIVPGGAVPRDEAKIAAAHKRYLAEVDPYTHRPYREGIV